MKQKIFKYIEIGCYVGLVIFIILYSLTGASGFLYANIGCVVLGLTLMSERFNEESRKKDENMKHMNVFMSADWESMTHEEQQEFIRQMKEREIR